MRVLTVRQPWAGLIVEGRKVVENRTWVPSLVVGERFAIHAGGIPDRSDAVNIVGDGIRRYLTDFGHVLGTVQFDGVHKAVPGCPCKGDPFAFYPETAIDRPLYHWSLVEPRRFATPFAARGALGLWHPDPTVAGRIAIGEPVL